MLFDMHVYMHARHLSVTMGAMWVCGSSGLSFYGVGYVKKVGTLCVACNHDDRLGRLWT